MDSSRATAAAAAGVEVVSARNREGTQDPLKHLFSAENLSKHNCLELYMNMYVPEAAIPQIVAIRHCTNLKENKSVSHLFGI